MKVFMRALKVGLVTATILATFPLGGMTAEAGSNCWKYKNAEKGFLNKINDSRARQGKGRLRIDKELSKVARKHTKEMTTKDLLYHTPDNAMRRRVTNWQLIGENVGVGATVDSLHIAFMNSHDHKVNIMKGGFKHVGIGTRRAYGQLWVTVIFEEETNPGTTLNMPSC